MPKRKKPSTFKRITTSVVRGIFVVVGVVSDAFLQAIQHPRIAGSLYMLVGVFFVYTSNIFTVIEQRVSYTTRDTSKALGLAVESVQLFGQENTSTDSILKAIDIEKGHPIMEVDVRSIKARIENLPWVMEALVETQYPSTLLVQVIEHEPFALWQHDQEIKLIDRNGIIIPADDIEQFSDLIILVGSDVPSHAAQFLDMITTEPGMARRVSYGIRVGERRWNVKLHNGIEIKLPEENAEQVWHWLLQSNQDLRTLDSSIESIDLRIPDKIFVKKRV